MEARSEKGIELELEEKGGPEYIEEEIVR